jgi:hypothetical protein
VRHQNYIYSPLRRSLILAAPLALVGCATRIPDKAFLVTEELLKQRQMQSRRFEGLTEESALIASSQVLQDMGYNLEDTEVELGVLSASKDRDATNAGEVVGAVVMAVLFGAVTPISKHQKIRVSLVVQPSGTESVIPPAYAGGTATRPAMPAGIAVEPGEPNSSASAVKKEQIPGNYVVRATFQRIVTRTDNSKYVQTVDKAEIYEEFFDKLSKAVFVEAQQV